MNGAVEKQNDAMVSPLRVQYPDQIHLLIFTGKHQVKGGLFLARYPVGAVTSRGQDICDQLQKAWQFRSPGSPLIHLTDRALKYDGSR